ncbi:amidohydrolase [Photobacterium makurazakiensis]|uniref:amidohydrolase n=1 Tax=Photobacterium makurazakiensis TaxID=2910234 RepID=UPI003D145B4C
MKKLLLSTAIASVMSMPAMATQPDSPITLFVSNDIVTLSENDYGKVNAIAVQDGKILDVGKRTNLEKKYAEKKGFSVNTEFEDKVLTPGFVEPHIHLWMMGILLSTEFITPADWDLPWAKVEGVQGHDAYVERLTEIEKNHPKGQPLVSWGYHNYFHDNNMSRELLNSISKERPIIVWHRSFHELFFNDAAMEMMGWNEDGWSGDGHAYTQLDWERGHAFEAGAKLILNDMLKFLVESGMFATGMERTRDYTQSGGITTAIDPGVIATPEMFEQVVSILEDDFFPMDYWLMPAGNFTYMMADNDPIKGKAIAEGQTQHEAYSGENIKWLPKFIKLFADGAMYSQLMQLKDGYTDGHAGEWIQEPADLEASMRPYWKDDYTIYVHANGDLGFETAINILEKMNKEYAREDHRTGFHHLGITDKDDIPKAVELGANFSVNPYYTHILAELYSEEGVGKERAETMARGRSFIDAGGTLSLHSDSPMAPAQPLSLMWAAVNRTGLSGEAVGKQERITVDEAMRAITIDAAYTARLENEIGTIDIGKYANFTVLDSSPYKVKPENIKDIQVEATIYQGTPAHLTSSNAGLAMTENTMSVVSYLNSHQGHNHDQDTCTTSLHLQQAMSEIKFN